MDILSWIAVAGCGAAVGVAAGLMPSLHVNTLIAIAFAAMPVAGERLALGLVAAAGAHGVVAILPATYLGAPSDETAFAVLPAHRLLLDGRAALAVRVAARASVAATVCALALLLPYKWLLLEPGRLLDVVAAWMPWILVAVLGSLSLRDLRHGLRAWLTGLAVMTASGVLGLVSGRVPVEAWIDVPATPLLPLLTGLFGAATLLESLRGAMPIPRQDMPLHAVAAPAGAVGLGVAAAATTSVLPGLTAAVATALARAGSRRDDAQHVLATQAAVASAHGVFSIGLLWLSLRARTGLAAGLQTTFHIDAWTAGPAPPPLRWALLSILAGALAGWACLLPLDAAARRALPALPQRPLTVATLAVITALVVLLSGLPGLALFAVSILVGVLPSVLGAGRVHLTAALLVPVLGYHWHFT